MRKIIFSLLIASLAMSVSLSPVLAQEDVIEIDDTDTEEVVIDAEVTASDLEVNEQGGIFGWFKNRIRDVKIVVTRDPIKKSKLQLEKASVQLLKVKKLAEEEPDDERLSEKLEEMDTKYQGLIEKVNVRIEEFKQKNPEEEKPELEKFLDKYTDQQLKHQQILKKIEENVPEAVTEKIQEKREEHLERFGEVMNKLQDKEELKARLENAIEDVGEKIENRAMRAEIIEELEEKVPEEVKVKIQEIKQERVELFQELKVKREEIRENWQEIREEARELKESAERGIDGEIMEEFQETREENQGIRQDIRDERQDFRQEVGEELETDKPSLRQRIFGVFGGARLESSPMSERGEGELMEPEESGVRKTAPGEPMPTNMEQEGQERPVETKIEPILPKEEMAKEGASDNDEGGDTGKRKFSPSMLNPLNFFKAETRIITRPEIERGETAPTPPASSAGGSAGQIEPIQPKMQLNTGGPDGDAMMPPKEGGVQVEGVETEKKPGVLERVKDIFR